MLFMSGAYPNLFDPNNKPQSPELTGESVLDFLLFNAGADAWLRSVIKWNASAPIEQKRSIGSNQHSAISGRLRVRAKTTSQNWLPDLG